MRNLELAGTDHIVIGTWAMSRREPHLFCWRDENTYNNEAWLAERINPEEPIETIAKSIVIRDLIQEGVDPLIARNSIKGVRRFGSVIFPFPEEESTFDLVEKKSAVAFVQVKPQILKNLEKDQHLLIPARNLHPYSIASAGYPLDRKVEMAFKRFVSTLS